MLQVGTWSVNLPVASPAKRRSSGETVNLNPRRRAGAPAYIKPNLKWDDFGISFIFCDKLSSCANARYINLRPGWTLQQARAEAMTHYDENEEERVREYNFKLVTCWARARPLNVLYAVGNNAADEVVNGRPIGRCGIVEDMDRLNVYSLR